MFTKQLSCTIICSCKHEWGPQFIFILSDNCNRKELHVDHHGDIDVEISFKTPTTKTITLLVYTSTFGGVTIGKDMQVNVLSTDN